MNLEEILKRAERFPHVFKLLPIVDGKPTESGTWAAYPHDEVTTFWINTSHVEAQKYYSKQLKFQEECSMAKALTVQEDKQVKSMIANNIQAIKSVLPKHLTPERAARIAYTALVKNPTLARCTQLSLMNSIIEASILGLEVGGPLRQATLIPFKNKHINGYEATLVVEYQGMIVLANNTGNMKNITAHPVFQNDQFQYNYGLNPDLSHIPCPDKDPGKLINAYAIIQYMTGGFDFEVIGEKVASEAKERSAAKFQKDSPWNKQEDVPAMWVKTAIRRLMNRVPKSAEIRKAMHAMDTEERSGQDMNHVIDISLDDFHSINMENAQLPPSNTNQNQRNKQTQNPGLDKKEKLPQENFSKETKQVIAIAKEFQNEYQKACDELKFGVVAPERLTPKDALKVYKRINELLDIVPA
ncbi:MAG: hypothetical protein GY710_13105 [Desulfobacteraceae bacterium]|nr:hypothetical protein [Desulfobacteraceae bacterium]